MDVQAEAGVIARLKAGLGDTTLIIITHRPSLLELVDRVIVIDQGGIVLDGPKALLGQAAPLPVKPAQGIAGTQTTDERVAHATAS